MKKLLCILCCLIALTGHAQEPKICQGERAKTIATLKESLKKCRLDFENSGGDLDRAGIVLEQTACLQDVADEVFNAFYKESKEEKHNQFTKYVESMKEQYKNLESGSDIGKHWHTATIHFISEVNDIYFAVYDMVKEYIRYMELECIEFDDAALEEMKNI